jgi:hypothetical protein
MLWSSSQVAPPLSVFRVSVEGNIEGFLQETQQGQIMQFMTSRR